MVLLRSLAASLAIAATASAHAMSAEKELALRDAIVGHSKRSLDSCAGSSAAVALRERAVARRAAKAQELRFRRGLETDVIGMQRRDDTNLTKWAAVDHKSSADYSTSTPVGTLFAANTTCTLVPETMIGPYWVSGELIKPTMNDAGEAGVPLYIDVQFVDIKTCQPVPALMIDAWHANALGVYSGVANEGQGGLNSTFGRAVQVTDDDGVVQFDTIFPGHYTGRATHVHVMATAGAQVYPNGTWHSGVARHIGQIYFDQDLITEAEKTAPYTTNEQVLTTNLEDWLAEEQATDVFDPFVNYVTLGDSIEDGILSWISIGIDVTANHTDAVSAASFYYENGGVSNPNAAGPPDGGPGGPGGPPPGGMPPRSKSSN